MPARVGATEAALVASGGSKTGGAVPAVLVSLRAALLARRIACARLASSAAEPVCGGAHMAAPVAVTFLTLARTRAAMRRHRLMMIVLSASAGVFGMVSIACVKMSTSRSSALGLP